MSKSRHTNRTLGQRRQDDDRRALSDRERKAAALLYRDDWSKDELALVFETKRATITRNLKYEGAIR